MIPWRLTFSGIRDYPPTLVDLSGANEHVMITGPNGAGKSTITFCMGAVLYSAKVDVEGLKSRNLPMDQTWKAKISLLFHNEGLMKIDAPAFLEFTLKISQEPGQPMKKEFSIASGDLVDEWENTVRYTSGDRLFSFSTYKKDLQYKYKIDPDLYYLIWYQQEVNQFAVMNPEERFRIFSEMHGIDKVQLDWEGSMEKVKDTEETLRIAESNVKYYKQELSMKKTALDRFLNNQKRLHEGGRLYIESLLQLEKHYHNEKNRLNEVIEQLKQDMEEVHDELALKQVLLENNIEQYKTAKQQKDQINEEVDANISSRDKSAGIIGTLQARIEELDQELQSITKKKNQITRTEEEVKEALEKLSKEEGQTNTELEESEQNLKELGAARLEKMEQILRLEFQVDQDEQAFLLHSERLGQYQSSHAVQSSINSLEKSVTRNKEEFFNRSQKEKELAAELALLEENRDLSVRQVESMKYFRTQQIKAYPLRELIELDEGASIHAEHLFNAIKYTIFFDGKNIAPPNDLYHVPLRSLVPERMVENLPGLHLKVKENLGKNEEPHALKALWWVGQFFKEGIISIKNGSLIDPMGIRGPQEKNRYILSIKALKARKQDVEKLLNEYRQQLSQLKNDIETDTKKIQELNSIMHLVRESEAFMTAELERTRRKEKLAEQKAEKSNLDEEISRVDDEKARLTRLQIEQELQRGILEAEADIYMELGKMKDKYEERTQLQVQLEDEKEAFKNLKRIVEQLEDALSQLERDIVKMEQKKEHIEEAIDSDKRKIDRMKQQQSNRGDERDAVKLALVQKIKELEDMKCLIPTLYDEVSSSGTFEKIPPVAQLKDNCEKGKIRFDNARTESGIDPQAPENYETVKQEFERLDNEYKRTKILLDQDKERMEGLKDQLETTINMRVLELQQKFKAYMGQFQFEGDISWDSFDDRKNRTHFQLFIKARKEGHRGTMEDVSTKARGGRVGKGVSGGEESLSSLLFALALLQNLQTTPGFIVLDEFDSALDENRKGKVFDLYVHELKRKLIILTPKSHEETYLNKFSKAFVVQHDPTVPKSRVVGIVKSS